jgi:hypothetical protein
MTLTGVLTGDGPYHLGAEVEVFNHWGEGLSEQEAIEWNIPLEYAHVKK